jgi:hypothetical protein
VRRARLAVARTRVYPEIAKRWTDRFLHGPATRKTHVLVTGFPRSGTSLFYNMMCTSLEGFAFDDRERSAAETLWRWENRVSKRPFDLFELQRILDANIHGKRLIVVLSLRDIRDIATSIHPKAPDDYLIGYEGCYRISGSYPNYRKRFSGPGIGDFQREFRAWQDRTELEIVPLRYEELVADPPGVQERLVRELGLRFSRPLEEFHRHRESHRMSFDGDGQALAPELVKFHDPVSRSYVGRWAEKQHRERIRRQFGQYPELFEILLEHGYEKDDSWFETYQTDGVDPHGE